MPPLRVQPSEESGLTMKRAKTTPTHYHLCPRCGRATPAVAKEKFCPNDGTKLLTACPQCNAKITSPYSRYCSGCGHDFGLPLPTQSRTQS